MVVDDVYRDLHSVDCSPRCLPRRHQDQAPPHCPSFAFSGRGSEPVDLGGSNIYSIIRNSCCLTSQPTSTPPTYSPISSASLSSLSINHQGRLQAFPASTQRLPSHNPKPLSVVPPLPPHQSGVCWRFVAVRPNYLRRLQPDHTVGIVVLKNHHITIPYIPVDQDRSFALSGWQRDLAKLLGSLLFSQCHTTMRQLRLKKK